MRINNRSGLVPVCVMLLGGIFVFPSIVRSESGAYLGPRLGIHNSDQSDDNGQVMGGATLRLKLLPGIAAEGDIGYRRDHFGDGAVTIKQWPITATGLVYLLPYVYGGIGAGWYNTTTDYSSAYNALGFDDNTEQLTGWHLAAGVEVPTSGNVKLFGDVRFVFLDYDFEDLPGAVIDGEESDFYSINFGLLFGL